MFQCKYCGCISHNPNVFWCSNLKCENYGVKINGAGTTAPSSGPGERSAGTLTYSDTPSSDISGGASNHSDKSSAASMPAGCFMPNPPCNNELPLGFATVPFQTLKQVYRPKEALMYGTLFPELNMPWKSRLPGAKRSY